MKKHYINASTLLNDAVKLALKVLEDGYQPDLLIGIWRGGAPVAVTIQEVMEYMDIHCDHMPVATRSYEGMIRQSEVRIENLEALIETIRSKDRILIVDDVWDTGNTIDTLLDEIVDMKAAFQQEIRIAVPYFKPGVNKSLRVPDYYLHENNEWLVFPHELVGLTDEEVLHSKRELDEVTKELFMCRNRLNNNKE